MNGPEAVLLAEPNACTASITSSFEDRLQTVNGKKYDTMEATSHFGETCARVEARNFVKNPYKNANKNKNVVLKFLLFVSIGLLVASFLNQVFSRNGILVDDQRPPTFKIDQFYKEEQDKIDNGISDEERCRQFGVSVLSPEDQRHFKRKLFFGSMIANENTDVLVAHAIEVYNKYDVVALAESNTTQNGTPRRMNFPKDSFAARTLVESEFFGTKDQTKVFIDYYLENEPELTALAREVEHRNTVWKRWVAAGMKPWDIGIMGDIDEIVSRDFLNALKVCDFPTFRYDPNVRPDCQTPKMNLAGIIFESSPSCIKQNEWFQPSLIPGNCLLGIGDNSGRVIPEREFGTKGHRTLEWGYLEFKRYPKDIIENKRFPLWDGRDIREVNGNKNPVVNYVPPYNQGHKKTAMYGTAFHLHNWFSTHEEIRHKYATYGHAFSEAKWMPLSQIQGSLDTVVRCIRKIGNDVPPDIGKLPSDAVPFFELNDDNKLIITKKNAPNELVPFGGNRPIYFKNEKFVKERDEFLSKIIEEDENKYGTFYKRGEEWKLLENTVHHFQYYKTESMKLYPHAAKEKDGKVSYPH